ncbi:MAG: hypothetical protein KY456_02745 [Chloroflexi bacterium]|nr:hypothetical protein [Chloroflexota bacterium]
MTGSTFVSWEYLTIPERERHRLAALGQEAWELAGVGGSRDEPLLYLKRPRQDLWERVTVEQRNRYYESQGLDPLRPEEREPA